MTSRAPLIFLLLAFATHAFAHTPDTSYCRISIETNQVAFKFSYDLNTLQRITPLDTNGDKKVSRAELDAATPAIQSFIRRHIYIDVNQRETGFIEAAPLDWPPDAGEGISESEYGQRLMSFTFRNPVVSLPEDVTIEFDFFESLSTTHTVLGVFACNGHEDEVIFTRFEPDFLYDTGYVMPLGDQLAQYFKLGAKHIFLGYDHLAFLLALLFVTRFSDLLKIITAFTIAHALTLGLAAYQIVQLPQRIVEIGIAVTIMYVAAENLWMKNSRHRWMLTFAFGLVHGFGFATVLSGLGLPSGGLVRSLLAFNVGVEAGQILIVALLWPLWLWVGKMPWAPRVRTGLSVVIFLFGAAWFVQRAFGLRLLPF